MKDMNFLKENKARHLWHPMAHPADSIANPPDIITEGEGVENPPLPPDYLMNRPYAGLQSKFNTELWNQFNEGLAGYGFISRVPTIDDYVWSGAPRH